MSQKSTFVYVAATLLVAVMISTAIAMDYSTALGNGGVIGIKTPGMLQLSGTPFAHNDMGNDYIKGAAAPNGAIGDPKDPGTIAQKLLGEITSVAERTEGG